MGKGRSNMSRHNRNPSSTLSRNLQVMVPWGQLSTKLQQSKTTQKIIVGMTVTANTLIPVFYGALPEQLKKMAKSGQFQTKTVSSNPTRSSAATISPSKMLASQPQHETIIDQLSGKELQLYVGDKKAVDAFIRKNIASKGTIAAYGFTPSTKNTRAAVAFLKGFENLEAMSLEGETFENIYAAAQSMALNQKFNWFNLATSIDGTVKVITYTGAKVIDEKMNVIARSFFSSVFNGDGYVSGVIQDQTRTMLLLTPSGKRNIFVWNNEQRFGHLTETTDEETRQTIVNGVFIQAKVGGTHLYGITPKQINSFLTPGGLALSWEKSAEIPGTIADINLLETSLQGEKSYVSYVDKNKKMQLVPFSVIVKTTKDIATPTFKIEASSIPSKIGAIARVNPVAQTVLAIKDGNVGLHSFDSIAADMKPFVETYSQNTA